MSEQPKLKRKFDSLTDDNNTDFNFVIKVNDTNTTYHKLQKLIGKLYIEQSDSILNQLRILDVRTNYDPKVFYEIPYDTNVIINYKDNLIKCRIEKISKDHGLSHCVKYLSEMSLSAKNKEILDRMIIDSYKNDKDILVYQYSSVYESWKKFGKIQKRDESTLIINNQDKIKLLEDIEKFIKSKSDYEKYGIPYKRNYLFHGRSGSGKTSLVNVIATKIKRSIYIIAFDKSINDEILCNAVNSINNDNAILLLEDIDCIFQNRNDNNKSNVNFSTLLNILDGVRSISGLIIIITTNYAKKLDPALMRPGRIDMMLEFLIISKEQILGLLDLYKITLDNAVISEIIKLCQKHELTPAVLSGFLFRNRDNSLTSSCCLNSFKKYISEIEISLPDKNYENIYA